MKIFNSGPFFFGFFYCTGQSENPELGTRPREYITLEKGQRKRFLIHKKAFV
jgi:hypothetical protein